MMRINSYRLFMKIAISCFVAPLTLLSLPSVAKTKKSENSATPIIVEASKSAQSTVLASWTKDRAGKLQFQFKTQPAKGLKINSEGPWSLELKNHTGLELETKKLGRNQFDEKLAGFSLTAQPKAKTGTIDFKMVVFVCTENKTQCFRDVQKGTFAWQAN